MQSYPIEAFWSDEDEIRTENVPGLSLCMGHGSTPQAAVEEVEVAVEAWLEAANAEGRVTPTSSLRKIQA
jgi:predicted RNase H-like HicB family nuclease